MRAGKKQADYRDYAIRGGIGLTGARHPERGYDGDGKEVDRREVVERQEDEGDLTSILHASGIGHFRLDAEGRFVGSALCRTLLALDSRVESFTREQLRAYAHPDDDPPLDQLLAQALASDVEFTFEHRKVYSTGAVRSLVTRGRVRRSDGHEMLEGIVIDLTERKAADLERERLVSELAAERARLRALIEHIPAAIMVAELSSRNVILMNRAFNTVFGSTRNVPIDLDALFRAIPALRDDGSTVEAPERPLSRALRGETVTAEEFRYQRTDGSESWVRLSSAPVLDDKGTMLGAVVIAFDVDRERRAVKALFASERRLRQIFNSPVIGIFHSKLTGPVLDANDFFLDMLGYTREDLQAGGLNWRSLTPPEFRAIDEVRLAELHDTGSHVTYEKEYFRKDGSRLPILLGGALFEGAPDEVVSFALDISDRKTAEAEREKLLRSLELSDERYRLAALATDNAIYDWDIIEDRISLLSKIDRGKMLHKSSWAELIHPEDREKVVASLSEAVASGESYWQGEYRFRTGDGIWSSIVDRGYVLRDGTGRPVRMVGAMQDVTARKRQEEFERQLIGIVSHDLKNPLQTILLAAEMLGRSNEVGPRATKNVMRIQAAAERAARMIRDLLDFTRARLGTGIPISRRRVALGSLFRRLVDDVRTGHPNREIDFVISGDVEGDFDADRLAQVLTNLVENALKYSSPESTVWVGLRGEADDVVLTVRNLGPVIPPEFLGRIFEPLHRGNETVDPTGRSVGLGLYIVKHLVEAHGGRVDVRSSPDEGTEFGVWLPRTYAAP